MPKPIDSEHVIAWLNVQIEKAQGGWLHDSGFPTNVIAALTGVKRFVKNLPTFKAKPAAGGKGVMTNGDRIRAMDDEELAYFLKTTSCSICCDNPLNCGFYCASLYTIKAEKPEQEVKKNDSE